MTVRKEYNMKVRELNDRLMMAERAFTDRDGLSSRSWYKHLVPCQNPTRLTKFQACNFPGKEKSFLQFHCLV